MTKQALKDNAQNIAGVLVGLTALKFTGLRFGKSFRGSRWFSTVAANLAADGVVVWAPYR
ncbi:hypothetical protein [Variovorax sp. UC122_21]|uniref:hypothetical protein n=1 Tax=Variovorax sp. UC122_21 TaxID=3374554 RepID=UPI003757759F